MNLLTLLFGRNKPLHSCKIARTYILEKNTIEHDLAAESLIESYDPFIGLDFTCFTDDGDISLSVLYTDLCAANKKAIDQQKRKRLSI